LLAHRLFGFRNIEETSRAIGDAPLTGAQDVFVPGRRGYVLGLTSQISPYCLDRLQFVCGGHFV